MSLDGKPCRFWRSNHLHGYLGLYGRRQVRPKWGNLPLKTYSSPRLKDRVARPLRVVVWTIMLLQMMQGKATLATAPKCSSCQQSNHVVSPCRQCQALAVQTVSTTNIAHKPSLPPIVTPSQKPGLPPIVTPDQQPTPPPGDQPVLPPVVPPQESRVAPPAVPQLTPDDLLPADDAPEFGPSPAVGLGSFQTQQASDLGLWTIGDFFGGGGAVATLANRVSFSFPATGYIVSGAPGSPNAVLAFEADGSPPPGNDFFTAGLGTSSSGGAIDTFAITEPLPPNEVPTSPGPPFQFDGGTVRLQSAAPFQSPSVWLASYSFTDPNTTGTGMTVVAPTPGLSTRRVKLGENNSPLPRNRIYASENFFNDVFAGLGDINRYTVGFEKAFRNGLSSIDVRFPFASTLSSDQTVGGTQGRGTEFGNISLVYKHVFYQNACTTLATGLGINLPSADDTRLFAANRRQLLQINNRATHLLPYVAMHYAPFQDSYIQAWLQIDVDASGNPVYGDIMGRSMPKIGQLQDPTLLFADVSLGYFLYRNPGARLSAIVPVGELHYTTTVQDADVVSGNGITITAPTRRFDVLNLTLGTHIVMGTRLTVTPAMVIPLRQGDDRQYDYEAVVQANYAF